MKIKTVDLTKNMFSPSVNIVESFSFDESVKKIEKSYKNKFNVESYLEDQLELASTYDISTDTEFKNMMLSSIIFIVGMATLFVFNSDDVSLITNSFITSLLFGLSMSMYIVSNFDSSKNKKLKILENNKHEILNNIDYYLPLSSSNLFILMSNNPELKEYIYNNRNIIFSKYEIDKFLNNKEKKLLMDNAENLTTKFLNVNDEELCSIKKSILIEQNKVLDIENLDSMKKKIYKVNYSVDNGPSKEILLEYTHRDENVFKEYISTLVENDYNRNYKIISIKEV